MSDSKPPPELERLRTMLTRFAEEKSLDLDFRKTGDRCLWELQWQTGSDLDSSLLVESGKPRGIYISARRRPPAHGHTDGFRNAGIASFPLYPRNLTPIWVALEAGLRWLQNCEGDPDAAASKQKPDPPADLKRLEPALKNFADDFRLRLDLLQDSWGCHWRLRWITSMGAERAVGVGYDNGGRIHVWVAQGPSCHAESFDDRTGYIAAYPGNMTDFAPLLAALEAGVQTGETMWEIVNEDGRPAIEGWIGRLQDGDPRERVNAAHTLGRIGDRNAVPALLGALDDVDRRVRLKAAEGLGLLGEPAALSGLQWRLPGADSQEQTTLRNAIERIQRKLAFIDEPAPPK